MEDIQDLLDCNDNTDVQQKEDNIRANIFIQELKQRWGKEKVTPGKQKDAVDNVFQALGQELPRGTKQ